MGWQGHGDRDHHRYVDGLLAVSVDAVEPNERENLIGRARERARGGPAVPGRLQEEFRVDRDTIARVTRHIDIIEVDDPEAVAREFADDPNLAASPIHALGFNWHMAMTATKPDEVKATLGQQPPSDRNRVIAVVDTGVAGEREMPGWMSSSIIRGRGDLDDTEDAEVSHGTFVASLLRQVAPTHTVSMAKAASYGREDRNHTHPAPDPTTEFHVADAIHRLIDRHRGRPHTVEALNLSVGGPVLESNVMVTVGSAIGRWREVFPWAPIFAAAGNSTDPGEIYPAAFRHVRGVSAANHNGDQIVWDDDGGEVVVGPPPRAWVDDMAPGSKLIGLSGQQRDHTVKWSGSSFATAVATASYVNRGPVEVRDGLSYWPDRAMGYGNVPGLKFE